MKSLFSIQNKKIDLGKNQSRLDFESQMQSMQANNQEKSVKEILKTEKIINDYKEQIFSYPTLHAQEENKKYVQDIKDPFLVKKVSKNLFYQKSVLEDKSFDENAKIPKQL
jgi:hypothetical protein